MKTEEIISISKYIGNMNPENLDTDDMIGKLNSIIDSLNPRAQEASEVIKKKMDEEKAWDLLRAIQAAVISAMIEKEEFKLLVVASMMPAFTEIIDLIVLSYIGVLIDEEVL